VNALTFVQLEQREVWRGIPSVKRSGASVEPRRFKRKKQERDGARHFGHDATERFGRLMHRPPDKGPETDVPEHQASKSPEQEQSSELTQFQH
jgi:hypothetical protein